MVIGFKKQFVEPIKCGTKIHTIREDKHRRWKAGAMMHMATGVRTKFYDMFRLDVCHGVQRIRIKRFNGGALCFATVQIDGKYVSREEWEKLAINDGFKSQADFFEWFNKDFEGVIIHWTNFRY